jgi:hypothetical protein
MDCMCGLARWAVLEGFGEEAELRPGVLGVEVDDGEDALLESCFRDCLNGFSKNVEEIIDARRQFEKEPKAIGNKRNRMSNAHRAWIEERHRRAFDKGF